MALQTRLASGIGPEDDALLRAALQHGVWTDPPLVGVASARFDDDALTVLREWAESFAREVVTAQWRLPDLSGVPVSEGLLRVALHELGNGTALVVQSKGYGNLDVSVGSAHEAVRRIAAFAAERGAGALVRLYYLHATFLNYRALRYYGEIRGDDFVFGRLHRPWCDWRLTEELRAGLALGEIEPMPGEGGGLRLTERGLAATVALEEAFRSAGVQHARDLMREGSARNLATDARRGLYRTMPALAERARALQGYIEQLQPIRRAVEVGSVSGMLAVWASEGRLGDAEAICCGSSQGRLLQVQHDFGGRIAIMHCLSDGSLPFADGSVDLAVLPATPVRQWMAGLLQEFSRILRPGGRAVLLTSRGWQDAFPREVRQAMPSVGLEFLARTDAVYAAQAASDAGFEVLRGEEESVDGEVTTGEALYALLGETGVLTELHRWMPIAEAERREDELFDACAAALRAVHGRWRFAVSEETVLARR